MKQIKFFILALTFLAALPNVSYAQVKVGDNPSIIDDGSILEVESTTGAFVPPRMTAAQMDSIPTPLLGATVFNTDVNCMCEYRGAVLGWMNTCVPANMLHMEKTNTLIIPFLSGVGYISHIGYDSIVINKGGMYSMVGDVLTISEAGIYEIIMQTSFIVAQNNQMTQGVADADTGQWIGRMSTFTARPTGYNATIGDGFTYTTLLHIAANQRLQFLAASNAPATVLGYEGGASGTGNVTNITFRKVE